VNRLVPKIPGEGIFGQLWKRKGGLIAGFTLGMIGMHLVLRFVFALPAPANNLPLLSALVFGGGPLVYELFGRMIRGQFGSDLLAGISIVTSILLEEYLAGAIVVLMLSGGETLEQYAVRSASSVLKALAGRMPSVAHCKRNSGLVDIPVEQIAIGDRLAVLPHEICPVDGVVVEGHGVMDESFLTGEPFQITKAPGAGVLSGAINGESALTIEATKLPVDSRYARIMEVMRESEQTRPRMRRLGDQLGAWYTPLALAIALLAWLLSGEAVRFLAVLVVATPCPLLIGIPIAIIGSISLAARRGIIIKDPAVLEQVDRCRTVIFDKTGTLTYGQPALTEQLPAPGFEAREVLGLAASLEQYSKHPLAVAVLSAARADPKVQMHPASSVSEQPGHGLRGVVCGQALLITSRKQLQAMNTEGLEHLPPSSGGLECCVIMDGRYAATYRFRDAPRAEGVSFIRHLKPRHRFEKVMILSGDRESEVLYLAGQLGISEIHAQKSPEEKLDIVRQEMAKGKTMYVGDGINDAPAMMASTVGIAIGQNSDVTTESAGVVVMEGALKKVDEFLHISRRMRTIALQSALGGMILSAVGMALAAFGYLPPVAGALTQEFIDVLAIANALRAAWLPGVISDFEN
jgi:heavy metal translocating P-type ATPase